ncbi:MAG TPA: exonuclease domain-containing protein, partial [Burkholderiales bacterium]
MFDRSTVFLDLETTGASASHDRITEIGMLEVERGRLVGEWSTLVNPEAPIPPAIEALTGISNEMVRDAPTFADLAGELLERLEGRLLVAHNARFDYGFLRNEFRRLGIRYQSPVLCTVKLSRRLYPAHHRHNLDSLIERHGIICSGRHRALGDARVLWEFVQKSSAEVGAAVMDRALEDLLRAPATPPGLGPEVMDDVPEGPGVYVFYGDNEVPLYVGKG